MKLFLVTLVLGLAAADVAHLRSGDELAQILEQVQDISPDGAFQWAYKTDNGIAAQAQGQLINAQSENAAEVVQGRASWKSPEGDQISFEYVADENGYQPQGSHLPTPPPIPEAIQRALEFIRAHPPPPEN